MYYSGVRTMTKTNSIWRSSWMNSLRSIRRKNKRVGKGWVWQNSGAYKLYLFNFKKMRRNEVRTLHHIIPRNGLDVHWTNDDRNKILLPEHTHINIHRVFWNLEFHNKVLKILAEDSPVIQKQFASELRKLMHERVTYIYVNWVYQPYE